MWIQVRESDNIVTRLGDTKRSPRDGTLDYRVARDDYPDTGPYETVHYDGTTFTVVHDTTAHKMSLEPELIALYRKWQDAESLNLSCKEHCKMKYELFKEKYDNV